MGEVVCGCREECVRENGSKSRKGEGGVSVEDLIMSDGVIDIGKIVCEMKDSAG